MDFYYAYFIDEEVKAQTAQGPWAGPDPRFYS